MKPEVIYYVHDILSLPILCQINLVHMIPFPILILSSHLHLSLPSDLSFRFPHIYVLTHTGHMPHPSHPPWFEPPNNIWWEIQIQCSVSSIFLSTLFSSSISLCSCLNVRDKDSQLYKTTDKNCCSVQVYFFFVFLNALLS